MKHKAAYKDSRLFNMPYKVMLDYWEGDWNENDTPLTIYYPFESVPSKGVWHFDIDGHYSKDEWARLCLQPSGDYTEDGKACLTFRIPEKIQELIDNKGKPYRLWDLETAAGKQAWLYYFGLFLMPYEDTLTGFSVFDMFGDTKHDKQELNERITYFMGLIDRCKEQPELYRHDIQIRSNPIDICYTERDKMPGFDTECKDTSTRAYRLNEVIRLLEDTSGE